MEFVSNRARIPYFYSCSMQGGAEQLERLLPKQTSESYRKETCSKQDLPLEEVKQPEQPSGSESRATQKIIELIKMGDDGNAISNYFDSNGYMYTNKKPVNNGTTYFRCKNSVLYNCHASIIVRDENLLQAIVKCGHNHPAERKNLDRATFNKKLEHICQKQPFFTPRACYQQAKIELKNQVDRRNIPSLKSFESFIYRCQKVDIPLLPKSVDELESLILDPKYRKTYSHDEKGQILFRGVWRGTTGDNVAFVSESILQETRKQRHLELLMDGTFKVLPFHIKFRQLYIINVIIEKISFPLAYILMERKDTDSYKLVLNEIKLLISSRFRTIKCMTDYEAATRNAIKAVFPDAELHGCYFHYVQAIVKRFRKFGLSKNIPKFNRAMQQISALALLPSEFISIGFNCIAKRFKKSKRFARFADYWRRQWEDANISVFGLKNRTNNFAESLNKSINLLIGSKHPHIWRLLVNMKLIIMDRTDELERVLDGEMVEVHKRKEMKRLNEKINKATKLFLEDKSVERFLNRVTYNENLAIHFKERIHFEGVDDEEYYEEDECDDVIPNNFRQKSRLQ